MCTENYIQFGVGFFLSIFICIWKESPWHSAIWSKAFIIIIWVFFFLFDFIWAPPSHCKQKNINIIIIISSSIILKSMWNVVFEWLWIYGKWILDLIVCYNFVQYFKMKFIGCDELCHLNWWRYSFLFFSHLLLYTYSNSCS